ncbi:MAG: hypothetical protein IJT25_00660, partial [Clostridia bacterium]|nr:hypothetical protein [Clostridia bacterium]
YTLTPIQEDGQTVYSLNIDNFYECDAPEELLESLKFSNKVYKYPFIGKTLPSENISNIADAVENFYKIANDEYKSERENHTVGTEVDSEYVPIYRIYGTNTYGESGPSFSYEIILKAQIYGIKCEKENDEWRYVRFRFDIAFNSKTSNSKTSDYYFATGYLTSFFASWTEAFMPTVETRAYVIYNSKQNATELTYKLYMSDSSFMGFFTTDIDTSQTGGKYCSLDSPDPHYLINNDPKLGYKNFAQYCLPVFGDYNDLASEFNVVTLVPINYGEYEIKCGTFDGEKSEDKNENTYYAYYADLSTWWYNQRTYRGFYIFNFSEGASGHRKKFAV